MRKKSLFLAGAGCFFFKYGMNRLYMWVERKKLVEKRKERCNLKKKIILQEAGSSLYSCLAFRSKEYIRVDARMLSLEMQRREVKGIFA